jgi:hypothetical protein
MRQTTRRKIGRLEDWKIGRLEDFALRVVCLMMQNLPEDFAANLRKISMQPGKASLFFSCNEISLHPLVFPIPAEGGFYFRAMRSPGSLCTIFHETNYPPAFLFLQ